MPEQDISRIPKFEQAPMIPDPVANKVEATGISELSRQRDINFIDKLKQSRFISPLAIGAVALGIGSGSSHEVSANELVKTQQSPERTRSLEQVGLDQKTIIQSVDKIDSGDVGFDDNMLDHQAQGEDEDLLQGRLPYTKYEFIIAKFYRLYPSAEGSSWLNHFKRAVFTRSGYVAEAVCGPAKMGLKKYVETYSPTVNTITTYDCRGDKDVWTFSSEEGSLFESPEEVERRMLRAGKDTLKITQIKRDHTKGLEKLVAQPQKQRIKTIFEKSRGGVKSISIQEDKVKKVSHYK